MLVPGLTKIRALVLVVLVPLCTRLRPSVHLTANPWTSWYSGKEAVSPGLRLTREDTVNWWFIPLRLITIYSCNITHLLTVYATVWTTGVPAEAPHAAACNTTAAAP